MNGRTVSKRDGKVKTQNSKKQEIVESHHFLHQDKVNKKKKEDIFCILWTKMFKIHLICLSDLLAYKFYSPCASRKGFCLCAKIQFYDWGTIGMNIMQEDLEKLTFKGHNESKRNRGKQRITYQTSMCKWLVKKEIQRDGEKTKLTKNNKGKEVVMSYLSLETEFY